MEASKSDPSQQGLGGALQHVNYKCGPTVSVCLTTKSLFAVGRGLFLVEPLQFGILQFDTGSKQQPTEWRRNGNLRQPR